MRRSRYWSRRIRGKMIWARLRRLWECGRGKQRRGGASVVGDARFVLRKVSPSYEASGTAHWGP